VTKCAAETVTAGKTLRTVRRFAVVRKLHAQVASRLQPQSRVSSTLQQFNLADRAARPLLLMQFGTGVGPVRNAQDARASQSSDFSTCFRLFLSWLSAAEVCFR
jgi:hypothetical protein